MARQRTAVWAGKTLRSDEHMVGASIGTKPCRSIWRRPAGKRFEKAVMEKMCGRPWEPIPPLVREARPRQVYITVDRILRLGKTPDCPGCKNTELPHSAACRERFTRLIRAEKDAAATAQVAQVDTDTAATAQVAQVRPSVSSSSSAVADVTTPAAVPMELSPPVPGGDGAATGQVAPSSRLTAPRAVPRIAQSPRLDPVQMDTGETRKRAASTDIGDLADADAVAATGTVAQDAMVAAMPTLHENDTVAAPIGSFLAYLASDNGTGEQVIHATVEWGKTYYAAKSGLPLDTAKVLKGRQKELDNIVRFGVKSDMLIVEAKAKGIKIVSCK